MKSKDLVLNLYAQRTFAQLTYSTLICTSVLLAQNLSTVVKGLKYFLPLWAFFVKGKNKNSCAL